MTEADILAATYDDCCNVYRPVINTLETGESTFLDGLDGRRIYKDIPCAFTRPSGGKLNRTGTVAHTPTDYRLFTRPEIDIQPGDTLEITQLGKVTVAQAGLPDRKPSHNNVPLILDSDTV